MLRTVIQAVPNSRERELGELTELLRVQQIEPVVVMANRQEPPRSTFLRALLAGCPSPWIIYLQDDAVISPDFAIWLGDVLPRQSFSVLMLYCNLRESVVAYQEGRHLTNVAHSRLNMAVGLAIAGGIVPAFRDFLPKWENANSHHNAGMDLALGAFCRHERLIIRAIVPSIVQHRDTESLLGHPCGRRKSRTFTMHYGALP